MTSAVVIEDHPLFCDALVLTLQSACQIDEVETFGRLTPALERIESSNNIDVIVLDLQLPDVAGLDGLIRLKSAAPDIPIVVVSSIADERVIASASRIGAAGYVPKHSKRDVYREAFRTVGSGRTYFPQLVTSSVASTRSEGDEKRDDALDRLKTLTRQQQRILDLICEGKLNKQIAFDLCIAETTVKAHVTAIMRKLGVQSRTQAVLIAREASFSHVLRSPAEHA